MVKEKSMSVSIINEFAAGIDVGSKSHFVAVGQSLEDVKEFGVDTRSHLEMIKYLKAHQINSIAMESTGNYWQTLFHVLQSAG